MRGRRIARLGAIVSAAALVAGCTAAGADRSGGTAPPRELVLANNDGEGLVGAPAVALFVDRVEELSGGRLTVRIEDSWQGGNDEARVIQDVAAGEADLGWSGTRAFDTVGVDAFRPLHAPFLITSYAAQAAVVTDPLADELLGSLEPLGLTGLALAADQLRFPAAADRPLLSPADFEGLVFRTVASEVQSEALRALGAEPTSTGTAADSTEFQAAETMWWTYEANGQFDGLPYVTRNAVLWPRTVAVFANADLLADLDEEARGWLTEAAADAESWAAEHAGDAEGEQMQSACRQGARIATATPDQLAALRAATEPVYAAMRSDAGQAATLARIEELVTGS